MPPQAPVKARWASRVASYRLRAMPRAPLAPIALLAWALLSISSAPLSAQDSVTVAQDSIPADSLSDPSSPQVLTPSSPDGAFKSSSLHDSLATIPRKPPVGPTGALWRSLLVPGWGQAKLGRGIAAGIFIAIEGVSLGMVLKTNSELQYTRATDSTAVQDKSNEREDWIVILAVNHLLAGLEAYVSAHLWDFPGDLALKPTQGGVAASVSFPVRVP